MRGWAKDAVVGGEHGTLHHVDVEALVLAVDARHVLENGGGVLGDEGYHEDDGEQVEEPRTDEPCERSAAVLLGEVFKKLARHEEEEPDAELQHEARELGTLEVLLPLVARHDARHQLDDHDDDHGEGKDGPDAERGAYQAPQRREREALPYADVFGGRKHALQQSRRAAVAVAEKKSINEPHKIKCRNDL